MLENKLTLPYSNILRSKKLNSYKQNTDPNRTNDVTMSVISVRFNFCFVIVPSLVVALAMTER